MRLSDMQLIGDEMAFKWNDGSESFIRLEALRRNCPCAGCKGETDIMGNVYKDAEKPLGPEAFKISSVVPVGGYAIQPIWGDGHGSGLYTFEYLRGMAQE